MKLIVLLILLCLTTISKGENVTKFHRKNVFLSRRKRYVQWPKGSNFVINLTCSKPLLRYQPLTWNTVYEMDIPFAVPPDNKIFFNHGTKSKRHVLERKHLFEHLEDFMTSMGLNGQACINRLLCESEEFIQLNKKSMFRDLVKVIFTSFLDDKEFTQFNDKCEEENFTSCPISLLGVFINSSKNDANTKTVSSNLLSFQD